MSKYVNIPVITINGELLERPIIMSFECFGLHAVGIYNARNYDANDCIEVKKVFGLRYGTDLYGTTEFEDMDEWVAYRNRICMPCRPTDICCPIVYNECFVIYKGEVIFSEHLN